MLLLDGRSAMHASDRQSASASGADSESISRRSFLQAGAVAGAALTGWSSTSSAQSDAEALASIERHGDSDLAAASIAQLQARMSSGKLTSRELVEIYLRRIHVIDRGLDLSSVIQLNPDARK